MKTGRLEDADKTYWWKLPHAQVYARLNTDPVNGLTWHEAQLRQKKYGYNRLDEQKKIPLILIFLRQFSNMIVAILILAVMIALLLGEIWQALTISIIIFLNALIGFVQEYSAERSLAKLKKLIQPKSRVIREGKLQNIQSDLIVPGDILILEPGNCIPADGRIIYSAQLTVQESNLTGESIPIIKTSDELSEDIPILADKKNMVFMGTTVASGKGIALITSIAMSTELGKVSSMLKQSKESPIPLQIKLDIIGRSLVIKCLFIIAFISAIAVVRGLSIATTILTAFSLAVAAVPEGLPALTTITLALGVRRMARRNVLIRNLTSVETLGCTTVICTDKTGTLTRNQMVVTRLWTNQKYIDVTQSESDPTKIFMSESSTITLVKNSELYRTLYIGTICNTASLHSINGELKTSGDPTEIALLMVAHKAGLIKELLEKESRFMGEIPFDPDRKCMSVIRKINDECIIFTKGASDVILERSEKILINGQESPFTDELKKETREAITEFSSDALRVLAFAYRRVDCQETLDASVERSLIFVGLMAMIDPLRPEAYDSIQKCQKAGIQIVMITGDHKETALAIARKLDILKNDSIAVNGIELESLSEQELIEKLAAIKVYARVSISQKIRIVKAWQSLGHVVAMTGDGVNDAPALKTADIGIAMGITGSDVAKEASDMIITDDNFASISNAVEEGRGIYDTIIKCLHYLFSANLAEVFVILFANLCAFHDPKGLPFVGLLPLQLLWLNLITDGLPALALSVDPFDPHSMNKPPRLMHEDVLPITTSLYLNLVGLIIAVGVFILGYHALHESVQLAHTMILTTFVLLEFVRIWTIRLEYNMSFFSNKLLLIALLFSLAVHLPIVYNTFFQKIFGTVSLSFYHLKLIFIDAVIVFIAIVILQKVFSFFYKK